jgi:hypothetical protein
MHRSLSTLFLVACLLVAGESRAGAWLQARGASYLKLTAVYSATDDRLDGHGNREPAEPFGGTYRERKLFWYGEYGVLHWLTLVGSFGWGEQEIVDALVPDYGTRSTGDLKIAGRWGLWRDPKIPISLETAFSIPTYPATDPTLPVGQREQFLPSGSGEVELEFRLQTGVSLWPLPLYANVDGGYRVRGGQFGDQWLLAAEVGGGSDRFFGKLEFRGIWPTGDPAASSSAGAVSIEERNLRLGPEAAWRVTGSWWLGLAWSTLTSGRNTLDNDQWLLSVAWTRPGSIP